MLPIVSSLYDICSHTIFSEFLDRFEQMVGIYRKRAGFEEDETW
jgi:hypothetical protein